MKRAPAAAVTVALLALSGCGAGSAGGGTSSERASQTIENLERALAARDFGRICDRIFSPEGRRRAGGEDCQRRLARTTTDVRDPTLEVVSARREGGAVVARVRAYADGERPAIDVVRLVPAGRGYRVESLSGQ